MALPLAAIAGNVAKQVVIDLVTDPEKTVKKVVLGVLVAIFLVVLIFALPVILIVSLPTLMFGGGSSTSPDQAAAIAIYSSAPDTINKQNNLWIDNQKAAYSWCDDIVVKSNSSLSWQSLMAIDSVRFGQDFTKANQSEVTTLANMFIVRKVTVETYTVEEKPKPPVTKHRAVMDISTKSFDTVLNELGFSSFEKQVANNIYSTLMASQSSVVDIGNVTITGNVMDWKAQIVAAATKWHVEPALIAAIMQTESGGNPYAQSPVGAIGLLQLMPGTAADLGVNPYNAAENIDGGTHYISILLKTYSMQEAIASYNCGPGNVDNGNWLKIVETVNYVARVSGLYQKYIPMFAGS